MTKLYYLNVHSYILENIITYRNEFNVKLQIDKPYKIILPILELLFFSKNRFLPVKKSKPTDDVI